MHLHGLEEALYLRGFVTLSPGYIMHIVAAGGYIGRAVFNYIYALTEVEEPRILYVPTAAGDSMHAVRGFYFSHHRRGEVMYLPLYDRKFRDLDLHSIVESVDVIYAEGGNTVNLLGMWRARGLDEALREKTKPNAVLCGASAGALCWFAGGVTDSLGPGYNSLPEGWGLGLVDYQFCPHLNHGDRFDRFLEHVERVGKVGIGVDDDVAVHFHDDTLITTLSSGAYSSGEQGRAIRFEVLPNGDVFPSQMPVKNLQDPKLWEGFVTEQQPKPRQMRKGSKKKVVQEKKEKKASPAVRAD